MRKRFSDQVAVNGLSPNVHEGEFFSVLGPFGCGKTTILRMIAGFVDPDEGRIELDGNDMVGVPPYRRDVNTVFQSYALFPHMSVWDNVARSLKRQKIRGEELKKRVAVARALAAGPQLLLLDEPLGALDAKLRKELQVELMRIQREVGTTFLYVTHDQEEALVLSHRIAVMNAGKIEQVGCPEDVYECPATRFVAGFVCTSNILDAGVSGVDGELVALTAPGGTNLRARFSGAVSHGQKVAATVRPEKVHLFDETAEPPTGWCVLQGVVRDVVYTGVSTQFVVDTPGGELVAFAQNARRIDDAGAPGQPVRMAWDPEFTVLLEKTDRPARPRPRT